VGVNDKFLLGLKEERVCIRLNNLHTEYNISCMTKKQYNIRVIFFIYFFISIPFIL
jgi:hypothetical protein